MPVRDLDVFAGASDARVEVAGTRGASGIDGVLSAALGTAAVDPRPVVLLVGDLSFLHDLGALQIAHRHRLALTVVVANNDGGSIFSHLPQAALGEPFERYFVTPHGLDLEPAVAMAGGRHHRPTLAQLGATLAATIGARGLDVVDVHTDRAVAVAAHRACVERAVERVDAMLGAAA
jgi:2-succinyl-5-enolpyruvyl-6-hydroxy-3-cyclohexene-1-carboxylate synthase